MSTIMKLLSNETKNLKYILYFSKSKNDTFKIDTISHEILDIENSIDFNMKELDNCYILVMQDNGKEVFKELGMIKQSLDGGVYLDLDYGFDDNTDFLLLSEGLEYTNNSVEKVA